MLTTRTLSQPPARILKIEKVSTFVSNREKRLANRYLSEAWSKRGRALQAYLEI